jgi:hypothetical protein
VFASGFENIRLPRDYFDLIVSNLPFAKVPVHDPETRDRRLCECVHDYFFVKSLPLLKPGGILASITSRYTLDKRKNVARHHLAMHAELLAAVRLPSGAFKQNAGTEVITDVIILRKRPLPIDPDHAKAREWVEAAEQRLFNEHGDETELLVNKPRGHSISVITPRPRSLNWRGYVAGKRYLEVVSADEIPPDVMAAVALVCLAQIEADAATHQDRRLRTEF